MHFRIIETNDHPRGNFMVEYRKNIFHKWEVLVDGDAVREAIMKKYFGPLPGMRYKNIDEAKLAIKNEQMQLKKESNKRKIVWEE